MLNKLFSRLNNITPKQISIVLVVLIVIAVGTYLIVSSHAATPYVTINAGSGILSSGATKQTCPGSSDGNCVKFVGTIPTKLLSTATSIAEFSGVPSAEISIFQQLKVNSDRVQFDFNGTTFNDPRYDSNTTNLIDSLTSSHIVPIPLFELYVEISTLNISNFASATVNWCRLYCAGGSFYNGNPSANSAYGPKTLEILNEPYGKWWGKPTYPVTTADVDAYAKLLKDIRSGLNNAGLNNIAILAAANNNANSSKVYSGWDNQLASDGGFAAVQGVTIHAYGDSSDIVIPQGSVKAGTGGWDSVYYIHQFLQSNGYSNQANNVYITEDGWCITPAGGDCAGPVITESQRDANIHTAINQLATVPWIKSFNYYRLHNIGGDTFGLYHSSLTSLVADQTTAWGAFQSAAQSNGF